MLTRRTYKGLLFILLPFLYLHCDKKCQPPPAEAPKTITGNSWRLVSSTNPQTNKKLDRYTFVIMSFKTDFSGDIARVENNTQYETPVSLFKYTLNTDSNRDGSMTIVYYSPPPKTDPNNPTGDAKNPAPDISKAKGIEYDYQLSRSLSLTERQTGYSYEFVPFVGIVDPDSTCSF